MTGTALSTTLREVIARHLWHEPTDDEWATLTLPDLGLDSMSAIDLVIDIEETFRLQFPERLLVRETFETFTALDGAVRSILDES